MLLGVIKMGQSPAPMVSFNKNIKYGFSVINGITMANAMPANADKNIRHLTTFNLSVFSVRQIMIVFIIKLSRITCSI